MDAAVIAIDRVSKCFKLYEQPVDRLKDLLLPNRSRAQDFWALRDVDLQIFPGQTVGLVGQNGSGKSTLLQIVVGTLQPTHGTIQTRGRIAALLELGSGFNPEFTGRQNIFFNGRILGLTQAEITDRFDQIAAFADIGDMLEQPVKTYSSGMFVRLAFAVIINTDPDILIVDEALAVGDIYFQQKCFQRIRQLRDRGVTILFVSHDSSSIFKLCDRAVLLERGHVVLDDKPKPVLDRYEINMLRQVERRSDVPATTTPIESTPPPALAIAPVAMVAVPGSDPSIACIQFVRILNEAGVETATVISGGTIQVAIGVAFGQAMNDPHVGLKIRNRQGEVLFETNTHCMNCTPGPALVNSLLEVRFRCAVPLFPTQYTISIGVANNAIGSANFEQTLIYAHDVAVLTVLHNSQDMIWAGLINLQPTVSVLY
jgi:lipopolysaccharide transport system ATP-binding protein